MQVYYHRVRIAYDLHLEEFLRDWLPGGQFPTEEDKLQCLTDDNEILQAIYQAASDPSAPGHVHASRISKRRHFRPVYTTNPADRENHDDPLTTIFSACVERYGEDSVRKKEHTQLDPAATLATFPVTDSRGNVSSSETVSDLLSKVPFANVDVVLMDPSQVADARRWLDADKDDILVASGSGG